jgi:hypothetical protein
MLGQPRGEQQRVVARGSRLYNESESDTRRTSPRASPRRAQPTRRRGAGAGSCDLRWAWVLTVETGKILRPRRKTHRNKSVIDRSLSPPRPRLRTADREQDAGSPGPRRQTALSGHGTGRGTWRARTEAHTSAERHDTYISTYIRLSLVLLPTASTGRRLAPTLKKPPQAAEYAIQRPRRR